MRKLLFGIVIASSLFITSCTPVFATQTEDFITVQKQGNMCIIMDPVTGVEYIVVGKQRGVSIIPRYNADGTLFTVDQEE